MWHYKRALNEPMHIQAAILWEQGQPLSVEAAELDAPGPGEVLVELKAAGVCHSDLHPARGDWPAKTPLVLGHEGAGIVREIGPAVTTVKVGDHVVLCWAPACGVCPPCLEGRAVLCDRVEKVTFRNKLPSGAARLHARGQDVAPFLGTACFSDFVVVPEGGAIPVPRDVPFDALATIGCAVVTGVGAVTNAGQVPTGCARRGHRRGRRRPERRAGRRDRRLRADHRHRSAAQRRWRSRGSSARPTRSTPAAPDVPAEVRALTARPRRRLRVRHGRQPGDAGDGAGRHAEGRRGRADRPVARRRPGLDRDVPVRDAGEAPARIGLRLGPAGSATSRGSSRSTRKGG